MNLTSRTRARWVALVGVPLLFVFVIALQVHIDRQTRAAEQKRDELLLRSPTAVKALSLGYESLMADIYWTRTVQYYGARVAEPGGHFGSLWPLLNITTTLDPRLIVAYRFGAIFLSEPFAGADRPDLAIKLVKRGIAANPHVWRLYTDMGFLYYWWLKDYRAAATAYLEGSRVPDAPPWLKIMAARMDQKGDSVQTSRMIWSQVYTSTKNEAIRKLALKTLRGLKAKEDETQLDELAAKYRQRFGHYPASTAEMRDAGLLNGIPVDPAGYPYAFGPGGKSHLDPTSPIVIPKQARTPPNFSLKSFQ